MTEFKLEGYNLFVEMTGQIRRNVIYSVYQFQPQRIIKPSSEEQAKAAEDESKRARFEKKKAAKASR